MFDKKPNESKKASNSVIFFQGNSYKKQSNRAYANYQKDGQKRTIGKNQAENQEDWNETDDLSQHETPAFFYMICIYNFFLSWTFLKQIFNEPVSSKNDNGEIWNFT